MVINPILSFFNLRLSLQAILRLPGHLLAIAIKAHCHMMRHACGYYLMNQGYNTREIQDFLGHRFPQTH
nr:tyrosine-type recombinase/integrase [Nostoc sp. FACHB-892]